MTTSSSAEQDIMSFLQEMRRRRREMKLQVQAAKAKAREAAKHEAKLNREAQKTEAKLNRQAQKAEAKANQKAAKQSAKRERSLKKKQLKLDQRATKRMAKIRKGDAKTEKKALAAKHKHQQAMAAKILEQQRSQGFTADKAKNWVAAARMIVPVAIPLAYRAMAYVKNQSLDSRAQKLGVTGSQSARFYGHGAGLRARVSNVRQSLQALGNTGVSGVSGFMKDANKRLDVLDESIETAERMTPDQRRRTHKSVTAELNKLDGEILEMRNR